MTHLPSLPEDLPDLARLAAHYGSDPMHVQGAGGNVSIKDGEVMWIKASGTQMGHALKRDIFVATDLDKMRFALSGNDPMADQPAEFTLDLNGGLRPSIETSLHAVFAQRVVLHTHCIHTLAHAVRQDAETLLADKLAEFDWGFVPYVKPGANLARSVTAALGSHINVMILGNHGLIVAGDSTDEVAKLQDRVHSALAVAPATNLASDVECLRAMADDTDFAVAHDDTLHQLALDSGRVAQVTKGSLYPDHVIFCGIAVPAVQDRETVAETLTRIAATGAPPPGWLLVPGSGMLLRQDVQRPALVMMRCLADVTTRVPSNATLNYLSFDQNSELLNWDAEKYRQALNAN
ncbi:MAG: class II aldolase/adducin family protein [Litoreibacter sp.]|nr:class II aldolase/adducin family protein [Litoreibacter sp.]